MNNRRYQNYYTNNSHNATPLALIKEGAIYYKAVSPTDCLELIDYQLGSFLGFFLRAVGSVAL
jgi:hypothetical protein